MAKSKTNDKKNKNRMWLYMLIPTLLMTQFIAGHVSGLINAAGSYNITVLAYFWDYVKAYPFDFFSFSSGVYLITYAIAVLAYLYVVVRLATPKADMKFEEHGSNDWMTDAELKDFVDTHVTPDFPYSEDCTQPAKS